MSSSSSPSAQAETFDLCQLERDFVKPGERTLRLVSTLVQKVWASFHSTPQISVTYQGWDASKTVLAGQQFVVTWGQGQVEARIVERRQRRLAARSLGGGHLSRASAIAARICDENSALPPDTALEAMEADLS